MRAPASFVPLAYDREHSLFVRRRFVATLPPTARPLEELRFVNDAAWMDRWYGAIAADPARASRLADEVGRALTLAPDSRTLGGALVYLQRAQPALAEQIKESLEKKSR
jgi:hypothetical protein